jgi:hypothetical protein
MDKDKSKKGDSKQQQQNDAGGGLQDPSSLLDAASLFGELFDILLNTKRDTK